MNNPWEEIKAKLDIEDVISQYIQVAAFGSNLKAKCPFHSEKSASFIISKSKQIWHCFGCGLGGDVFGFVSEIENISRFEALQKLAKQTGTVLDTFKKNTSVGRPERSEGSQETDVNTAIDNYTAGLKMLDWASKLFNQVLQKEITKPKSPIKDYLLKRGLDQDQIQTFDLGFAPDADFLIDLAKQKKGISLKLLLETGLLVDKNEEGEAKEAKLRDKFKFRLMIPIKNDKGQVVGFTGRFLGSDPNRPKYLNSPQTKWFNKGELLFGIDLARKNVYQKKEIILVEGHLDLISAFFKGFDNMVASGGTSITETQIRKIKRLTTNLTLGLDNDEAGLHAAHKVFIMATKIGLNVNQLVIPTAYKDIDEYVSDESKEKEDLQTIFYLDHYLAKNLSKLVSVDAKIQKQAIIDTLELIAALDNISKEQYLKRLSDLTRISIPTLKSSLPKEDKYTINATNATDKNELESTKNKSTDTHNLINLKTWLALYQFLPENDFKTNFNQLVKLSWDILSETGLIPAEINQTLNEASKNLVEELHLIWSEELEKKVYLRPEYPKEIIKSIDNLILKRRQLGLLNLELNEKLFEYDVLRQRVLAG